MPTPTLVDYEPIIAEYKTGQYTVAYLAQKYGIKRTTLAKYISTNEIPINNEVKEAIEKIDKGLQEFRVTTDKIKSSNLPIKDKERMGEVINKGLEFLESKHGEIARYVVTLVEKGFKKGDEMLKMASTPEEYKTTMQAIKIGADTLGLFPKSPLVAIQQNISKSIRDSCEVKDIKVNISFVESKNNNYEEDDDDIIEVELNE